MKDKVEEIVKRELGNNFKVSRIVDIKNFLFVFYEVSDFSNPYNDERLSIASGAGPLRINKETLDYEITSLIEFLFEYGDNKLFFPKKSNVTFKKSIENILKRGRMNWEDFYLILGHFGLDFNEYDIYSINSIDNVYIKVRSDYAFNILIDFLKKLNADYEIDSNEKNKLFVSLVLPSS